MSPWAPVVVALVFGLAPGLIAWGAIRTSIRHLTVTLNDLRSELHKVRDELIDLRLLVAETTGTHRIPSLSGR